MPDALPRRSDRFPELLTWLEDMPLAALVELGARQGQDPGSVARNWGGWQAEQRIYWGGR